jgi:hypothetical protein
VTHAVSQRRIWNTCSSLLTDWQFSVLLVLRIKGSPFNPVPRSLSQSGGSLPGERSVGSADEAIYCQRWQKEMRTQAVSLLRQRIVPVIRSERCVQLCDDLSGKRISCFVYPPLTPHTPSFLLFHSSDCEEKTPTSQAVDGSPRLPVIAGKQTPLLHTVV